MTPPRRDLLAEIARLRVEAQHEDYERTWRDREVTAEDARRAVMVLRQYEEPPRGPFPEESPLSKSIGRVCRYIEALEGKLGGREEAPQPEVTQDARNREGATMTRDKKVCGTCSHFWKRYADPMCRLYDWHVWPLDGGNQAVGAWLRVWWSERELRLRDDAHDCPGHQSGAALAQTYRGVER